MRSIRHLAREVVRLRHLRADATMLVANRRKVMSPSAPVINVQSPPPTAPVIHVQSVVAPVTNQVAVPEVHNQVVVQPAEVQLSPPAIVVQVDMTSVADALDRLADRVSSMPRPVSRTTVQVPDGMVQVHPTPPAQLVMPPHEKRSFKIKHDDGTTSDVTEQ